MLISLHPREVTACLEEKSHLLDAVKTVKTFRVHMCINSLPPGKFCMLFCRLPIKKTKKNI